MNCKDWREAYAMLAEEYFKATGALAPVPISPQTGKPYSCIIITPERLRQMYIDEGMRMREIAEALNCSTSTVANLLKRAKIPARSPGDYPPTEAQRLNAQSTAERNKGRHLAEETKRKISDKLNKHKDAEFGGRERIDHNGYVMVYRPDHPRANAAGEVPKHTLVMERELGRYLEDNEVVHHINRVRGDNSPENLTVMDRTAHCGMHGREGSAARTGKNGRRN